MPGGLQLHLMLAELRNDMVFIHSPTLSYIMALFNLKAKTYRR